MNFIEVTYSPGPKVGPMATPEPLFALAGGASRAFGVSPKSLALQRRAATAVETSVETPQVPFKTPEAILALLSAQPSMTLSQVANRLGKSTRAIEMAVAKLPESGNLKYGGPKKGGHWEAM
jgi:predicted HTH transcriptional regulator